MSSNSIPLTFRTAPLPEGYKADPEQFKNDIVARLYAESSESIAFFASGSVAPSSNVGPWLKNGTEWYVWDNGLAMYIPQPVPQASLKWIAQFDAPDQTIYTFWIQLDGTGKAIAIKYYSTGAWRDIYGDVIAAETAARIAGDAATLASAESYTDAAIGSLPGTSLHPGTSNASGQTETAGPSWHAVAGFSYSVPVTGSYQVSATLQVDDSGMTITDVSVFLRPTVNGGSAGFGGCDNSNSPAGSRWFPSFSEIISANAGDTISAEFMPDSPAGSAVLSQGKISVSYLPS